ncbi:MAG: transposase [Actinobacteria bacterium]|nr:transposase [Actinomycetota bacterium]
MLPRSPWQNPFIESFNGKLRDELLTVEEFHTLLEAKIISKNTGKPTTRDSHRN